MIGLLVILVLITHGGWEGDRFQASEQTLDARTFIEVAVFGVSE